MTKLDRVLVALVVVTCMVLIADAALAAPGKGSALGYLLDLLWWIRR